MNRTQKRDLLLVFSCLVVILGANLSIYWYFVHTINTNYYLLPDEASPVYHEKIVFVALEKDYDRDFLSLEIRDEEKQVIYRDTLFLWEKLNDKFIHFINYTSWENPNENMTYRLFLPLRSWYSEPVQYNPNGYLEWVA